MSTTLTRNPLSYLEPQKEVPKCECNEWKQKVGRVVQHYVSPTCVIHGSDAPPACGRYYGEDADEQGGHVRYELNFCLTCRDAYAHNAKRMGLPFWEI